MQLAYNYINLDPNSNLQTSTLGIAGGLFTDFQPIWGLYLAVGIAFLALGVIIAMIASHHK